jgi:hypothetical protein
VFVLAHPVLGLQVSAVQGLPSSQLVGPSPVQVPAMHRSIVQALPSLQTFVWSVTWTHPPFTGSHESSVQGSPSSQVGGGPPTQTPSLQASFAVQALPSSQDAALGAFMQPSTGSQESSVQGLPSSQSGAGGNPPR